MKVTVSNSLPVKILETTCNINNLQRMVKNGPSTKKTLTKPRRCLLGLYSSERKKSMIVPRFIHGGHVSGRAW
jgi:hypothetical protein